MKMMIQIVLVALIFGGLSAGGSYFYHQKFAKKETPVETPDADESKDKSDDETDADADDVDAVAKHDDAEHSGHSDAMNSDVAKVEDSKTEMAQAEPLPLPFGPPAGVRPPWNVNGDEAGDLINDLRARAAATTRQERRIAEREEAMKLIVDDLSYEQKRAKSTRKRLVDEANLAVRTAEEARRATAAERAALYRASESERKKIREEQAEERRLADEQIEKLRREKDESTQSAELALKTAQDELNEFKRQLEESRKPAESRDRSAMPEETANLKNMKSVLASMPDESAAQALQEFVKQGRTEAVVLILSGMNPKKAGNVLSLIQEEKPEIAADLLMRLKSFKKPEGAKDAKPK